MSFNQGAPTVNTILNTSNCLVFGNTASGNALSVQQLGAGNCLSVSNANGTVGLFVSSTSNVGIGTTNPGSRLHVQGGDVYASSNINGNAGNTTWRLQPQYVNSNPFPGHFRITNGWDPILGTGQANYAGVGINLNSSQGGSALEFYTSTTNNAVPTRRVTIDGLGNVGIGADATAYMRLGMDTAWRQFICNNAYWDGTAYKFVTAGGYNGTASRIGQVSGTISFDTVSGGVATGTGPITWANRVHIANNGNVGVGTTDPKFRLNVAQDIGVTSDINSDSAQFAVMGATNTAKRMTIGYDTQTGDNGYGFIKAGNLGVAWTNIALQPTGGSVGVGTTSPGEKLDVSGNINARVAGKGGVKLIGNEAVAPGYVALYNPDGTRAAYFGFATFWGGATGNAINLQPEGKFDRIRIGSKEISTRARKFDVFQSAAPTAPGVNTVPWVTWVTEFIDDDCLVCWDASGYSAGGGLHTFTLERNTSVDGWQVVDSVATYFVNAHQKVSRSTPVRIAGTTSTITVTPNLVLDTLGWRIKFTGQVDTNDRASLSILRL